MKRQASHPPMIIAHRGVKLRAIENTHEALEDTALAARTLASEGIELGVELDVRRSKDGVLLVNHEPDRCGMFLAEHTYEDLRAAMGVRCPPTLATAVELIAEDVPLINVEFKVLDCVDQVVDLLFPVARGRLMLTSFIVEIAADLTRRAEDGSWLQQKIGSASVDVGWLVWAPDWLLTGGRMDTPAMLDTWRRLKTPFLILEDILLFKDVVDTVVAEGGRMGTFTMNDEAELWRWINGDNGRHGIEFLITDHPNYVYPQLNRLFEPKIEARTTWQHSANGELLVPVSV